MNHMSTILLVGGAGYIGSHTAVELLNAGYDVIVVDNYANSCPESTKRVEKITGKKIALYEADVSDAAAMEKIFIENTIDAVIHFADLKVVGESMEKPIMYYRNNIDTTLTLLETMEKFQVNNIIFSSSATAISRNEYYPKLTEHMGSKYQKNREDIYTLLRPNLPTAIVNARQVAKRNEGQPPSSCTPGTSVYEIFEKLKSYLF